MTANILLDELPKTVRVDGIEYPINWGFRANILMEMAVFSDRSEEQKLLDVLNLFYLENIPGNIDEAVSRLLWFFRCGKEANGGDGKSKSRQKRSYCFEQDAPLFYAAFRSQYGINLNQTRNDELHWWEFSAMVENLDENCKLSRVMYYRTADTKGMSKEQKAFITRMKVLYAIRQPEQTADSRVALARRNVSMLEYVRRRSRECEERR